MNQQERNGGHGSSISQARQVTEVPRRKSIPTYTPRHVSKITATPIEEATPEKPFVIPKPLLRKLELDYDIPGGCKVRLELKNGNLYHGTMYINPQSDLTDKSVVKLIKVTKVCPKSYEPMAPTIGGILEYNVSEIQKVCILTYVKPTRKRMGEMIMNTFVVKTMTQFKNLMAALTCGGDAEVAFKLFGFNKGRFMELHWIVLCTRQTLIPIDMQGDLNTQFIWMELKDKLFENTKILKIVHDVRFEADFLFHAVLNGIRLRNVFDTQLAVYFMDVRQRAVMKRKFVKENPGAKLARESELLLTKLSLSLARFLGNVVWERELGLMYKFESENWCTVTYFTERPMPPPDVLKYMALSVKYLHLLKNEVMSDMMLCYTVCCEKTMRHMYMANLQDAVTIVEESVRLPSELYDDMRTFATSLNLESTREIESDNRSFMAKSEIQTAQCPEERKVGGYLVEEEKLALGVDGGSVIPLSSNPLSPLMVSIRDHKIFSGEQPHNDTRTTGAHLNSFIVINPGFLN